MKVIFLDIDGVLNSQAWGQYGHGLCDFDECSRDTLKWDPAAVANLRQIVAETGAQIVVSSSWRGYKDKAVESWQRMFACYDWKDAPVIGETPDLNRMVNGIYVSKTRGDEVAEWLKHHPEVTHYVVIDDDADFHSGQTCVFTDHRWGLTALEARQAIRLLTDYGTHGLLPHHQ
jgi:hypothetical protein